MANHSRWPNLPETAIRCGRCGGAVYRDKDEWDTFWKCRSCSRVNTAAINRKPTGWRVKRPRLVRAVAMCQRRSGCAVAEVAARFGVHEVTLWNWRREFKLPRFYDNRHTPYTAKQRAAVVRNVLESGMTYSQAAQAEGLHMGKTTVGVWVRAARARATVVK